MLRVSADQGPPLEGNIDHHRCIVHFDIDCFYAQVEEVLNPSLRGKPIGIKQKYLLVTCNYTARSLGVRKMESLMEAKRRCPSLVVMDGEDLTRYREASEAIFSYIGDVCGPLVQRLGMDEIFVDVTALISSDSSDSSRSSGSGGADITGHLYAPGSGGTLLEAQTGLEISLNVDSDAGAHRCEGSIPGSPELSSVAQLTAQGGGHDISQESAEGSEGGTAMRDSPIATNGTSGSNVGIRQACTGRGNGDPPNGEGGGVRRGLGARSGAVGVGDCRCGCRERLAATSAFADRVRKGLLEVVGYTCSAGIGCSKLAAKMAGELHKPHQQTTILPQHTMSMISQLPLRKLPGCGHSTCAKIKADLGITESRRLQAAPWPLLVRTVGLKLARMLFLLCRGEDSSPVVPSVRPKTMSDEDSFKRGSLRSRQQVEHHARRLAIPLLLRVGERVRLHKEAPDTLRFGFRRASKGYGVRVTRQCAISSGVAAAWAAVAAGEGAAGVAGSDTAEEVEGGSGVEAKDAPSNAVAVTTAAGGAGVSPVPPLQGEQGQEQQRRRQQNGAAAEEGLSEVVRLVMSLFDKMVSPGEKLDLTLLSVGFAGFRSLGGTAQSGMVRYLEPSQPSAAWGGSSSDPRTGSRSRGHSSPVASTLISTPYTTPPTAISIRNDSNTAAASSCGSQTAGVTSSAEKYLPALETTAAAPRAAAVAAASPSGAGTGASRATSSTGQKRPRIPENPYRRHSSPQQPQEQEQQRQQNRDPHREPQHHRQQQQQQRQQNRDPHREPQHHRQQQQQHHQQHGDAAASEWEGAEILVVGQGGHDVPGRGSLGWCGECGAHVLRTDAQEHFSSAFHRRRACG